MHRLVVIIFTIIASVFVPTLADAITSEQVEISRPDGKLQALLYRPEGTGPFPAVIGLHGCGGINNAAGVEASRYQDWGQRLVAAGFAVLYPDSYGSRGLGPQCRLRNRSVRVDRERVADIEVARQWLQGQSWIAPERISLLGWSNGAITALWAVRPRPASSGKGPDFRSAVTFYPGCGRLSEPPGMHAYPHSF